METHGIHTGAPRKEITCSDCGHVYLIAQGQRSGACRQCGNVAFVGENIEALSVEIVAKRILPRLPVRTPPPSPLDAFRATPDGLAVEKIRMQYQVEWQLWAALVKNFADPAFHMAYLCQAIAAGELERAAERYREHRSVMAILADSLWQAEASDLMLTRIEAISISRMANARGNYEFDIPGFLKLLPYDSRLAKVGWIAIGLFLAARILHFSPLF
ncbi:MAG: hypothetical protein ACXVB9_19945 [Bdellovibrionota bacterium]